MKTISRYVSLISVTSLLAGGSVIAQTSGSSTGTTPTTRPYNSTDSGRRVGTSGGTNNNPSGTGANTYSSPGAATRDSGVTTGSSMGSSTTSGAMPSSTLPAISDTIGSSIQAADYNSRNQLTTQIEQQLDVQKETLRSIRRNSRNLEGQPRTDFKSAWSDVEDRERDLKRSLREARNASQSQWESVRSELASKYQAYLSAVSRAQMDAGSGVGSPQGSMPRNNGSSSSSASGMDNSSGMNGTTSGSGTRSPSDSTIPPTTSP